GVLERPRRANYVITDAGRELIPKFPEGATEREIRKLGHDPTSLIRPYKKSERASATTVEEPNTPESLTPIEQIESGIERIREEVSIELLSKLQGKEPGFFEEAVVELLLAMGYGGTSGAGSVTKMSNDGGMDGVIDQDILGLNRVYIQAKRYTENNVVGRPDLQGIVGPLSGKADSGVFITTSRFSEAAETYAKNVPTRMIMMDGNPLNDRMIGYNVVMQVLQSYIIVEIDENFFA